MSTKSGENSSSNVVRKEVSYKILREMGMVWQLLPRMTLRSWGFDPDKPIMWWDEPDNSRRVFTQAKGDNTNLEEHNDGVDGSPEESNSSTR